MLKIREHAGFDRAHDPHSWWIYDARMTSPKTCSICLSLDGTHYRGDELDLAFPEHVHLRANAIRPRTHLMMGWRPTCKCLLRWAGRSEDVLATPFGMREKPEKPQLRKEEREPKALSPSQHFLWWKITRHARETFRKRRG